MPRYCTAFVITDGKPLTIAATAVRSDESRGPAIDRVLDQVDGFRMPVERLVMDRAAYRHRPVCGRDTRGKLATHGYVAYEHTDRSPAQVARLYGRRATVEKSYQLDAELGWRTAYQTNGVGLPAGQARAIG